MEDRLKDLPKDAFARLDETDDGVFYSTDRFVSHLDSTALRTIEDMIGGLVIEGSPSVLDLMASWDSHIPKSLKPSKVVGLGLNENELKANASLTEYVIHDLNKDPVLPFSNGAFDLALCTVSVDYMTRPVEVFAEVGRILKPGGLFVVTFSNRFFPPKVVKIWRESSEEERTMLVEEFFAAAGLFDKPRVATSRGRPRPKDDKYAHLGIPSDPIFAVYAERVGAPAGRKRRLRMPPVCESPSAEEIEHRKLRVKDTMTCPYCERKLSKWRVPQTPFTEWPNEFFYVCFNDECTYFVEGWNSMGEQGNPGSYRFMYDQLRDTCHPLPVPTYNAFKDGIVDEGY